MFAHNSIGVMHLGAFLNSSYKEILDVSGNINFDPSVKVLSLRHLMGRFFETIYANMLFVIISTPTYLASIDDMSLH